MTGFPNLARGQNPDDATIEDVTNTCRAELEAAGIMLFTRGTAGKGEVPSRTVGFLSGWTFRRAWYYWTAEGPGIPPEIAKRLHATHGTQVRVLGHAGAPDPIEYCHGFAIGSYHVDTPEGLKALADTLISIYDDRAPPAPPQQPL